MVFSKLFGKKDSEETAHRLFAEIVKQARKPFFYTDMGVADSVDGRFDMITLHAYLLFRRMKQDHEQTAELSQKTFDVMFDNFDENLRELGVGDIAIGARIKKMASAFYGRVTAYDEGLAQVDNAKLMEALDRNLYRKIEVSEENLIKMATYVRGQDTHLNSLSTDSLLSGGLSFGSEQ